MKVKIVTSTGIKEMDVIKECEFRGRKLVLIQDSELYGVTDYATGMNIYTGRKLLLNKNQVMDIAKGKLEKHPDYDFSKHEVIKF